MIAALAVAASLARPAGAESDFLKNLHKAESRKAPGERVEYLDRAIEAWEPEEGTELLSNALLRRGEARYWLDDFAKADPDLSKAAELDSGSAQAYLLRGRIRLKQGKFSDAARDFREFANLKPDDIEGWLALGEAQARGGQLDAALESYQRAEQLDPADWRVGLGRARQAMAGKRWDAAIELLGAADAAAKGKAPEILVERAICKVARGRGDDALRDYDRAIPLYDRAVEQAARSRGRKLEAVEAQDGAARAYFGRGRVDEFLTRVAAAVEDYRAACRLGHQQACAKAEALASVPQPARASVRAPQSEPKPQPQPERKRKIRVDSDAGDRIYAN